MTGSFDTMIRIANDMWNSSDGVLDEVCVNVVLSSNDRIYAFFDKDITDTILKLQRANDTVIIGLVSVTQDGTCFIPAFEVRQALYDLNHKNIDTMLYLCGSFIDGNQEVPMGHFPLKKGNKMSKSEPTFTELLWYAEQHFQSVLNDDDLIYVIAVRDCPHPYIALNDQFEETISLMKEHGRTEVTKLVVMFRNGAIDVPSHDFRLRLFALHDNNRHAQMLLRAADGYVTKTLENAMPAKER